MFKHVRRAFNLVLPPGSFRRDAVRTFVRPSMAERLNDRLRGHIDWFTRLGDGHLLLAGWFRVPEGEKPSFHLLKDARDVHLRDWTMCHPREDCSADKETIGKIVLLEAPPGLSDGASRLLIRSGSRELTFDATYIAKQTLTVEEWAQVVSLPDPRSRLAFFDMLRRAAAEVRAEDRSNWGKAWASLHGRLYPRPEHVEVRPDSRAGLVVEKLLGVDEVSFVAIGWIRDSESQVTRVVGVSPEGETVDILPSIVRFARPDVAEYFGEHSSLGAEYGFCAFFTLPFPLVSQNGWTFEVENGEGIRRFVHAPRVTTAVPLIRESLLELLEQRAVDSERLLERVMYPAAEKTQARGEREVNVHSDIRFGPVPTKPAVSILVPLYKRIDFVEQQLAQFAGDPEIAHSELIYILDSPEDIDRFTSEAPLLYELYRVPFRIICLDRNGGYSTANNIAAKRAQGRLLLLLNSDVVPVVSGWLESLVAGYQGMRRPGALAPKLIYEDGSLQHAGMYFAKSMDGKYWENRHFFKGLEARFPGANEERDVPAVTGACLLISRDLYRDVGGLRGSYIQGDFEDSDLCLRLRARGLPVRYKPDISLYHLEGQSYPSPLRARTFRYNCWLHTRLWNDEISAIQGTDDSRCGEVGA